MRAIRYPLVVQDLEPEIKRWQTPPPVAQVRPTHCTWCKAASQPVGKPLVLVGHGVACHGKRVVVQRLGDDQRFSQPDEEG